MYQKKLLPKCIPPITSYQQIALPLSVIMLNDTASNWFYSNYIQVSCVNRMHYSIKGNKDNALHYTFYTPDMTYFEPADQICIKGCKQLEFFENFGFIRNMIDSGWYIYTEADMFYIDYSDGFGYAHYPHDLLIYGYDDHSIYIYMYDQYKLTEHIVDYRNFLQGYYSIFCDNKTYRNRTILLKPNCRDFLVNVEKIRWYIQDYLNGTESFARERPNVFNPDSLTMNGVETYKEFDDLINHALKNEYKLLRRPDLYCFYEHKKVMFERVVYLKDNRFLAASDNLVEEFKTIKKQAENLMFLGLKIKTMNNPDRQNVTLLKMRDILKEIKELEVITWNRFIEENRGELG